MTHAERRAETRAKAKELMRREGERRRAGGSRGIGAYPGIALSDRWNGFERRDPDRRQVCWSHIRRDFRPHSEGLG
jgi:Transposase IS66 family